MAYGKNAPFGLKPLELNYNTATLNAYRIYADRNNGATTYGTSIFTGDPVVWDTANGQTGFIARYVFNTDQTANASSNTAPVVGVFMGCEYTTPDGELIKSPYWPASTHVRTGSTITALVNDYKHSVYDIQVSTWTNALADARFEPGMIGKRYGFGLGGGGGNLVPNNPTNGTTFNGQSAAYLATKFTVNQAADAATLPLRVIDYTPNVYNTIYEADGVTVRPFLNVKVIFNNHI